MDRQRSARGGDHRGYARLAGGAQGGEASGRGGACHRTAGQRRPGARRRVRDGEGELANPYPGSAPRTVRRADHPGFRQRAVRYRQAEGPAFRGRYALHGRGGERHDLHHHRRRRGRNYAGDRGRCRSQHARWRCAGPRGSRRRGDDRGVGCAAPGDRRRCPAGARQPGARQWPRTCRRASGRSGGFAGFRRGVGPGPAHLQRDFQRGDGPR